MWHLVCSSLILACLFAVSGAQLRPELRPAVPAAARPRLRWLRQGERGTAQVDAPAGHDRTLERHGQLVTPIALLWP